MAMRILSTAVLVSLTVLAAASAEEHTVDLTEMLEDAPVAPDDGLDLGAVARRIVEGTNAFRADQDLGSLTTNEVLEQTAAAFARFMADRDLYGHTADRRRPAERAEGHGYDYCIVLENIAYQYSSTGFGANELSEELLQGWKDSPTHRENMLDPDVTETGVALARSERTGTYYAVQLFGRPQSGSVEFSVANRSDVAVRYRVHDRTLSLAPRQVRTYTVCRPPTLEFLGDSDDAGRTYRPEDGARFVVRSAGNGGYRVETP